MRTHDRTIDGVKFPKRGKSPGPLSPRRASSQRRFTLILFGPLHLHLATYGPQYLVPSSTAGSQMNEGGCLLFFGLGCPLSLSLSLQDPVGQDPCGTGTILATIDR